MTEAHERTQRWSHGTLPCSAPRRQQPLTKRPVSLPPVEPLVERVKKSAGLPSEAKFGILDYMSNALPESSYAADSDDETERKRILRQAKEKFARAVGSQGKKLR